jgi:transcriptional regulator GlxA family with amidase domain
MSGAMLAPAVAVVPLVWLDVVDGGTAMVLEHVAMFSLMLAVMLRRRQEYMTHHHGRRRGGRAVRSLARLAGALLAFLLLPVAVGLASSNAYYASRYAQPEATTAAAAAVAAATPPAHDPGKPTAVVVVGNSGANIADVLAPYNVLATTGAFNLYTVAPERRPLPLLGGLDLVPDLSFAQLRQRLDGSAPAVTVVPEMPEVDESSDASVIAWLRDTASQGLLLSVCSGARLLAEAGLLDGRDATSHWSRLARLQRDHPAVRWQRGIRYIDDGEVISTGGLLSSVDGTLRVVERLVGVDAAAAAARAVGWRYYSPGKAATLPWSRLTPTNAILHVLNVGFRSNATTVGVVLTDGVGELELAAAVDPYAEARAARTLAVAAGGDRVRSRHGLTFVPRADLDAAGRVEWLVVPGAAAAASPDPDVAAAARRAGVPVAYLHGQPGFAFDPALREMARTMDVPTARWAGKILEYSTGGLGLSGPGWPWTLALRPFLLGLAGLAIAVGVDRLLRMRRNRRQTRPVAAPGVAT